MTDASGKRRDAVANAARVVEAAAEVFAERGLDAPIPVIAARAGVGKATVYRNFPTKADLVMAIALDRMASIRASVDRALDQEDAWAGFTQCVEEIVLLQERDRGLGDALRHATRDDVQATRLQILEEIDRLLARAIAQGTARPDAKAADVRIFMSGVAFELTRADEHRIGEWRRYAALVVDAFRA